MTQLIHLRHNQIEKELWDRAIVQSTAPRVYAMSWYLDNISPGWEALASADYSVCVPLPVKQKFCFRYVSQPPFTQQLGIFAVDEKNEHDHNILDQVGNIFSYVSLPLNTANNCSRNCYMRKNYLLTLTNYTQVLSGYSRNAGRNIRRANEANIAVRETTAQVVIKMHRMRFNKKFGDDATYDRLEQLFIAAENRNSLFCFAAFLDEKPIASSAYILFQDRLIFLVNGNLPEALNTGATHLIKDFVIQRFCGQNITMDFEGSDNPNFSRFYEQFGATKIEYYPFLVMNKLPFPFNKLKR